MNKPLKEHLLKIEHGNPAKLVQQLKEKGVQVLHRFGDTLVVEGKPAPGFTAEVLLSTREIVAEPLSEAPVEANDEDIALLAFRLRQTENFRRSKKKRTTEGESWGEVFENL